VLGLVTMEDAPVASPCIDVCAIDPRTGWCEGCLRTIDEIAAWGALDDSLKREVLQLVAARRLGRDRSRAEGVA
jgi:predicted Fe-S protein YdhL (DUF1289 family)